MKLWKMVSLEVIIMNHLANVFEGVFHSILLVANKLGSTSDLQVRITRSSFIRI